METSRDIKLNVIVVILGFVVGVFLLALMMGGGWLPMMLVLGLLPVALVLQAMWGKPSDSQMEARPMEPAPRVEADSVPFKGGTLPRTIISGFIASMSMLATFGIAYGIALMLAEEIGRGDSTASRVTMAQWFYGLTHNQLLDMAQSVLYLSVIAHFGIGLLLALLYAYVFEPRMWGSGWAKGIIFSVIPWALSVAVFFPMTGGGFLGVELGAGPLPFLGNLVLHLVYGATLGLMYEPVFDSLGPAVLDPDLASRTEENYEAMSLSEQMAARGVIMGLVVGAAMGVLMGLVVRPSALAIPSEMIAIGFMLLGASFGALIGSFFGLPTHGRATGRR